MKKRSWLGIGLMLTALAVYVIAEGMVTTQTGDLTLSPASGKVIVNGNVGVGTTSPAVKLDVHASSVSPNWVRYTPSGAAMFVSATKNSESRDSLNAPEPVLILARSGVPGYVYSNIVQFELSKAATGGGADTRLDIKMNGYDDGPALTNVLSLMGRSGNVGVGTTEPWTRLDVRGDMVSGFKDDGKISLINSKGAERAFLQISDTVLKVDADSDIVLYPNNKEAFRVTADGNVGVGISSPSERLDVAGNIRTEGDVVTDYRKFVGFQDSGDPEMGTVPIAVVSYCIMSARADVWAHVRAKGGYASCYAACKSSVHQQCNGALRYYNNKGFYKTSCGTTESDTYCCCQSGYYNGP